jgi:glutamate synthase domain-containing protein 3
VVPPVAGEPDQAAQESTRPSEPLASTSVAILPVPEIRDYQRINVELTTLLDSGHRHIRLAGVEGQRLLVSGLRGAWDAIVEVEGQAGPELGAWLDAPGLTVFCRGGAGDGVGSGLTDGLIVVGGDAGAAVGYAMRGGAIVVAGATGPRAGLNQAGGALLLCGSVDRLAGERQSGGRLFALADRLGPHVSRGQRGGTIVALASWDEPDIRSLDPADLALLDAILRRAVLV